MMNEDFRIDGLVADLRPVRRLRPARGFALVTAATLGVVAVVAVAAGLRPDVAALAPDPLVVLRSAALVLLGVATLHAATAAARPSIGEHRHGWRWALAAIGLFPLTAAILTLAGAPTPHEMLSAPMIASCLVISLSSAAAILAVLLAWLRSGAVTDPHRAGWLSGLAAGGLGSFAYSLHCPSTSIEYFAVWYGLAIAISAGLGRLVAPPLLRW
ncbi:NrsF family protein [Sphingomonas baiyangensis]|uniref:DUF1109 domain-containing protein n=1 Tax=Sphingomonas baiyangensis TaxID=2572576 RepID=A0A4U1L833_9SPHN|nr:DUF1109 domain-containing protein [Sphingomonas baiyangensis]TKD53111.1 DUF1109 domain-containing protein [Sphingomonas baiyangensis]